MVDTCGFYWLMNGKLAGSCYPGPCLEWLYHSKGIRAILSLQPLSSQDLHKAQQLGFQVKTNPIPDYTAGSLEERTAALRIIDEFQANDMPTLVHCQGGLGRTGMILALYLVLRQGVPPTSAISQIRFLRKGSIERNTGQEEVILQSEPQKKSGLRN
ncbi:MAG: dual specificity protein phosphatase family protein [Promethearchaeota archaeon]